MIWLKDLKYSFRMLRKHPGNTAISIIALTLGIGLTTTMFSIVYGALYRGLPFDEPDRVMHLERNNLASPVRMWPTSCSPEPPSGAKRWPFDRQWAPAACG